VLIFQSHKVARHRTQHGNGPAHYTAIGPKLLLNRFRELL